MRRRTPSASVASCLQLTTSTTKAAKSFDWLCDRYYKSTYFQSLEEYTRRRKRTVLNEICSIVADGGRPLGSAPFAVLKKIHVRKLRDMKAATPEAANSA